MSQRRNSNAPTTIATTARNPNTWTPSLRISSATDRAEGAGYQVNDVAIAGSITLSAAVLAW